MPENERTLADFAKDDIKDSLNLVYKNFIVNSNKFIISHYLTRRLASVASFMILFGLLTVAGSFSFIDEIKLNITENTIISTGKLALDIQYFDFFMIIFFCVIPVIIYPIFNWFQQKVRVHKKTLINIYLNFITLSLAISLLIFKWEEVSVHLLFWGILIFIISYSSNRKYGFTRAYSRNRLYAQKVELLYAEKLLEVDDKYDPGCLNSDKNIRAQLHDLIKSSYEETHKDIVGDYIEYGNSALKWLSTKK